MEALKQTIKETGIERRIREKREAMGKVRQIERERERERNGRERKRESSATLEEK
jgi:hypothetical protein